MKFYSYINNCNKFNEIHRIGWGLIELAFLNKRFDFVNIGPFQFKNRYKHICLRP